MKKAPKVSWRDHLQFAAPDLPHKLLSLAIKYGDIVEVNSLSKAFLITHPDAIEHVLKKNMDNYSKDFFEYKRLGKLLGNGLLTTMGPAWLQKRRAIQALFSTQMLQTLAQQTVELTDEMLQRWDWYAKHAQPLNIVPDMLSLVLRISLRFLFSEDISQQSALRLVNDFTTAQRCMNRAISLNPWVPSVTNYHFYWMRSKIKKFVSELLQKRRALPENKWPDDLLTLLLRTSDTEQAIFDEIITFMATGHETTGNSLSWTWYCLAKNPEVVQQLEQEVDHVLSQRLPNYDDLSAMNYTRMVVQESLRFYPTIWNFARRVEADDVLQGFTVPAHSRVLISPFVMHRLPQFWQRPEEFIPERFSEENMRSQTRYTYIPFGVGPHTCIASTFSFLKLQLITSMLAQRFQFELLPESQHIPLESLISLRPGRPIRFMLRRR